MADKIRKEFLVGATPVRLRVSARHKEALMGIAGKPAHEGMLRDEAEPEA